VPDGSAPAPRWPVPAALDGERIDRALALITGLSRREVNGVLEDRRVRLGRQVVSSRSRKVHAGEQLSVEGDIQPERAAAPQAEASVDVDVVYEDRSVIVVDKPAGLVVHPGNGNRHGTLVHGLLARFPDLAAMAEGDTVDRPGIVHRLDRGTSGLLMVARTAAARDDLIGQLSRRSVRREYEALVFGTLDSDGGLIEAPLGRSDRDPSRMSVQTGGRPARTRYTVESRFAEPAASTLIRCRLETGRTHQIRVHLASIGHPVAGDDRYGGQRRQGWPDLPPRRPFLHAAALGFDHPETAEPMQFSSPRPPDLEGVLAGLSRAAVRGT
jgi:23S rRNA pseudouridine1911/1915/1917 synthase